MQMREWRSYLDSLSLDLADFVIGFVKYLGEGVTPKPCLAGSGTLVKLGSIRAILTAAHVLSNLPRSGPVGLILYSRNSTRVHQFDLNMETVRQIQIGKGPVDSDGPDLALAILPFPKVGSIEAVKSFYRRPSTVITRLLNIKSFFELWKLVRLGRIAVG